jgi:4-amino-4-deoxy-L-arabinose transferase-like glycosyltransferase
MLNNMKLRFDTNQLRLWPGLMFVTGNGLLLAPDGSLLKGVGALLVLLLPGLVIAWILRLGHDRLLRWSIGLGLGYALMVLLGLLLHYWPGPLAVWMVLGLFNLLTLLGLSWLVLKPEPESLTGRPGWVLPSLIVILLVAGAFRFINLGYSEFDGDETKAMIPAAEAIEGQAGALFDQRKKGPGEILVPMLIWRLSGLVTESLARWPFAVAGLLVILLSYLLGRDWFGEPVGLLAAFLLALNGLLVAFSRIVQYQHLVLLMSLLAMLSIWRWRSDGRAVWWPLAGLFLGIGVLSHYDALLMLPPLAYAAVGHPKTKLPPWPHLLAGGGVFVTVTALFGLPYWQAAATTTTTTYLGERIGAGLVKNQLYNFFNINSFYSSFYYIGLVSLLALIFLAMALSRRPLVRRWPAGRYWLPAVVVIGLLLVTVGPIRAGLALAWFALIFAGAIFSPGTTTAERVTIIWLATAFIGYNFFVATPRTHFYTLLPPLIFLAAVSAVMLWSRLPLKPVWGLVPLVGLLLLTGGYLTHAFLQPAVQYEFDWPASRLSFYWSPFDRIPPFDAYGFVQKSGWKTVGGLYLTGQLSGDYQTNGLTETAAWYTRHQLVGCYRQSRQFFAVAHRLVDLRELPDYQSAGKIELTGGKGLEIYQPEATMRQISAINVPALDAVFDSTATAAAFVPPHRLGGRTNVNFADAAWLRGYQVTGPVAHPGQQVEVTLSWQAQRPIPLDADVFVHLEDTPDTGNDSPAVWAQSNGTPGCGQRPTSGWEAGETIKDTHLLTIPLETPPGNYRLKIGLYLPAEARRAPVVDEAGQPVTDAVTLATLTIE